MKYILTLILFFAPTVPALAESDCAECDANYWAAVSKMHEESTQEIERNTDSIIESIQRSRAIDLKEKELKQNQLFQQQVIEEIHDLNYNLQ